MLKIKLYNKNSKGSDSMVKEINMKLAQNPTWGRSEERR